VFKEFSSGCCIFQQGDIPDFAYVIEEGEVEIFLPGEGDSKRTLALLGKGEIFGEMGLVDQMPRSASALALCDTRVMAISRMQILTRLENSDEIVVHLLKTLTRRMRNLNRGLVDKQSQAPLDILDELRLERAIRAGIENDEFKAFLQPIVTLPDQRVAGFEALVRWRRDDGTFVSPADFLPLAEKMQIVRDIDGIILHQACAAVSNVIDRGGSMFASVNLSSLHLSDYKILRQIERTLANTGLSPKYLKLEITESALISVGEIAQHILMRLKDMGCSISIDDFGTGYSSLSYLHQFPFDVMKIDRSFVTGIKDNPKALRIVHSLVGLAKNLGMEVVAEGIEEEVEHALLLEQSVDFGQGWLFGRPIPVDDFLAKLSC
jgi:EAL domain-containing protein (putative c-di-GMP-specific phosphodiesterase class I)